MAARADHLFSFFTPGAVARSIAGLAAFAVRRPALFAQLLLEGLRDRKAFVRLLRLPIDLDAIRNSPLFDRDWYRRNHPDLEHSPLSPELHCLLNRIPEGRWTSPRFSCDEYLALNPAVKASGVHPLVHYELYGRFINAPVSELDLHEPDPSFPAAAREWKRLSDCNPAEHRRTAVFATYSSDGVFPAEDVHYLRALREVCDNIVVSVNAPLRPEEAEKLVGLASTIVCGHHGGYDFGSWRIGMRLARERGLLAPEACRELVFANGSCYAPLRSFSPMFEEMEEREADFWSVTRYKKGLDGTRPPSAFLQSYFLVFRRPVLDASALECFFAERPERISRRQAVEQFEMQLTDFLCDRGFKPDAFVHPSLFRLRGANPTTRPIDLVRHFKVPLVKAKVFSGQTSQPPAKVLALVRRRNPALAAGIRIAEPPPPRVRTAAENAAIRDAAISRIGARARGGGKVRTLFFVSSASMFPARPLFEAMLRDSTFDARLFVIPDLRWRDGEDQARRRACREALSVYPADRFIEVAPNDSGDCPDAIGDFGADIVCYPSPYDFSGFRYNPHWAAGRGFLPIYISYSFSTSLYGYKVLGLQNYADFWKVFAECAETEREYAEHSLLGGANAETVGYFKMDALASAKPWPRNGSRKRILVAPHHSVEGGANDTLAFSNFLRYADYFLAMPERHPELDFVFRPHPFLFTVLSNPSKWGQAKVDDWIARMKSHRNVRWSDEGDYFPAFASCDAIVHDCGSFLAEWFYTGKPCCFMLKAPSDIDAKFTPLGKTCLSHCYLAYEESEIETFLHDVVEGGADPKAAARNEFRKTIMVNHPHAAEAALASIKRGLGLPG